MYVYVTIYTSFHRRLYFPGNFSALAVIYDYVRFKPYHHNKAFTLRKKSVSLKTVTYVVLATFCIQLFKLAPLSHCPWADHGSFFAGYSPDTYLWSKVEEVEGDEYELTWTKPEKSLSTSTRKFRKSWRPLPFLFASLEKNFLPNKCL